MRVGLYVVVFFIIIVWEDTVLQCGRKNIRKYDDCLHKFCTLLQLLFFCSFTYFLFNFFFNKNKKKCHFLFTSFAVAKFPRSALMVDHIQHCIITYIILKALSFYWSKMILDHPNCFGRMQIVLVGSELFWLDLNNFGQVPIILFWTKFIIRTCPK